MKKALTVRELGHVYDGINVLRNINFSVSQGSFFVIIGPNGSGKTTLIRLIAGMEESVLGAIKIMGFPLQSYTTRRLARILAYVPQSIPVDFPFTVSEVVCMGRSPHLGLLGINSQKDKKIIMESMQFTGVDNLAHRMMYKLSGGERQRVFIARAICQQPSIIILDEPTAALDIAHQIKVMDIMEMLVVEKNVTIIMVSHDINLAAMYCDSLLLIKSGSIVRNGNPREVLKFTILENTYGCPMLVDASPFDGIPRITPVPGRYFKNRA